MKRSKNSTRNTYTKHILNRIINIALLDMQFPFILALLGKDNIAETMGTIIVTEIVGVFLVYCTKSFFETKEEENIRLIEKKMSKDLESEEIL